MVFHVFPYNFNVLSVVSYSSLLICLQLSHGSISREHKKTCSYWEISWPKFPSKKDEFLCKTFFPKIWQFLLKYGKKISVKIRVFFVCQLSLMIWKSSDHMNLFPFLVELLLNRGSLTGYVSEDMENFQDNHVYKPVLQY